MDSVLTQTFQDYEVILVDDGSKDSSPSLCDAFAQSDSRVKVIHQVNQGAAEARNQGVLAAKGEYIIFIDSDDKIAEKTFFSDIHASAVTAPDLILYKFRKLHESTGKLDPCYFSMAEAAGLTECDEILFKLVKNDAYYGPAWLKAIRRELLVENHVEFMKGLLVEDIDWYYQVVLAARSIVVLDRVYIIYRQRAGSTTSSMSLANLDDNIKVLEMWSQRIAEAGAISKTKRLALLGALAKYYANLLIGYNRIADAEKKKMLPRMKKLKYLLQYSLSRRPIMIRHFERIFGLSFTLLILKKIDKAA